MPFGLGFGEMLLIVAVLLLLFGAKRLPEVAQGMGKGIRDFKRAINGLDGESIQGNENQAQRAKTQPDRDAPPAPQVQAPMSAQPQAPREEPVSAPIEVEPRPAATPADAETRP